MAIGLGASLNTVRDVRLSKVVTANRTTWAPFDFPGQTGTPYTGQALEFDGVSDKIQNADIVIPDLNTFTMAMWVNFPNAITANYAPCFFIGDTGFNHQDHYALLGLISNDNQIAFSINKTNGGNRAAIKVYSDTLSTDTWYRVVGVYDGNADRIYLYVNGVLIGTDTPSDEAAWSAGDAVNFTGSNNDLFMSGGTGLNNSAALEFLGSDAQFWDKAWSADEVTYDYLNPEKLALETSGTSLTYSNLKLWYPMNDGHRGQQSFLLDGSNTGLGDEVITSDMSWNLTSTGANWSQNGTAFTSDGSATGRVYTSALGSIVVGKTYKISYDITSYTSGAVRVELGTNADAGAESKSGIGSYSTYFTAKTNTNIYINQGGLAFVGTFDNLSILHVNDKNHGTSTFYGGELQSTTFTNSDLLGFASASATGFTAVNTDAGAGANDNAYGKALSLTAGHNYTLSWTTAINAGDLSQQLDVAVATSTGGGAGDTATAGTHTAADDYSNTFTAATTDTYYVVFRIAGNGAYNFTISNVTLKEVGFATGWTNADAQTTIPQLGFQSYNQMAWFDGVADYVDISDDSAIQNIFDGGGSISAWIYANGTGGGGFGRIMDKSSAIDVTNGFTLYLNGESGSTCKIGFQRAWTTTHGNWNSTSLDINYGQWYHVAVVYNEGAASNDATIYLNGVSIAVDETQSVGDPESDASQDFTIGSRTGATDRAFEGSITEVSLWTEELTLAKIQELYNDGEALDALTHSSSANLTGYWRNKGDTTWTDLSIDVNGNSNGNHGDPTSIAENLILPEGNNGRDTQGFLMTRERTSGLNLPYKNSGGQRVSYVDAGAQTISSGTDFTIGFWAKPIQSYNANNIMGASGSDYMYFSVSGSHTRLYIRASGTSVYEQFNSTDVHATNDLEKWQYWTITRGLDAAGDTASNQLRFYLNGEPNSTGANITTHAFAHDMDMRYLGNITAGSTPSRGVLDDIVIYNSTALTANQVARNYKAGKRRHRN